MTDFFDNNSYSHDPRTQFFNWSLMSNGAWDYPANTHGYTWGIVGEVFLSQWAFRLSTAMVPTEANMSTMDEDLMQAHSETIEIEHSYQLYFGQGIIRLLGYLNHAHMGNYEEALALPAGSLDVVNTRAYGRTKYGFGINVEQALSSTIGMMLRYGWNDGQNETWMFTEIDNTVSGAIVLDGESWDRKGDMLGVAVALNGISEEHRRYLAAGGYGFLIGDGALNYGPEFITEFFYSFLLPEYHLALSPDYQFVLNPAYNKDRGPVHVFGLRAHIAF
jgi:high affinity Mn2+ porin